MWITLVIKYWREIGIAVLALIALGIIMHIRHTYNLVDSQRTQIGLLTKEVNNAKSAIKLQADTQQALGRIDARTYRNISTILGGAVPNTLTPAGVLPAMR